MIMSVVNWLTTRISSSYVVISTIIKEFYNFSYCVPSQGTVEHKGLILYRPESECSDIQKLVITDWINKCINVRCRSLVTDRIRNYPCSSNILKITPLYNESEWQRRVLIPLTISLNRKYVADLATAKVGKVSRHDATKIFGQF